jgi:hypothetical protein
MPYRLLSERPLGKTLHGMSPVLAHCDRTKQFAFDA